MEMDLRDGGCRWGNLERWRTSRSVESPEQTTQAKYSTLDDGSNRIGAVVVVAAVVVAGIQQQLLPPPLGGGDGDGNWPPEQRPDAGHQRSWPCRPMRSALLLLQRSSGQLVQMVILLMSSAVAAVAAGFAELAIAAVGCKKRRCWMTGSNDQDLPVYANEPSGC